MVIRVERLWTLQDGSGVYLVCYTDREPRLIRHFASIEEATKYANQELEY